jgi:hypothetical protein
MTKSRKGERKMLRTIVVVAAAMLAMRARSS